MPPKPAPRTRSSTRNRKPSDKKNVEFNENYGPTPSPCRLRQPDSSKSAPPSKPFTTAELRRTPAYKEILEADRAALRERFEIDKADRETMRREEQKARAAGFWYKLQVDLVPREGKQVILLADYLGEFQAAQFDIKDVRFRVSECQNHYNLKGKLFIYVDVYKGKDQRRITLNDFSEFGEKVEPILANYHNDHPHKKYDVRIRCQAEKTPRPTTPSAEDEASQAQDSSKKRGISDVADPNKSPYRREEGKRNTYTEKQIQFRQNQHAGLESTGTKIFQLTQKLKCNTSTCDNEYGYCWVKNGEHHPIEDHHQREMWARAWQVGEADEHEPPEKVRKSLEDMLRKKKEQKLLGSKKYQEQQREEERREREEERRRREEEREEARWRREEQREQKEEERRRRIEEASDRQREIDERRQEQQDRRIEQQNRLYDQLTQQKEMEMQLEVRQQIDVSRRRLMTTSSFSTPADINLNRLHNVDGLPQYTNHQAGSASVVSPFATPPSVPLHEPRSSSPVAPPAQEGDMMKQFWAWKLNGCDNPEGVLAAKKIIDAQMWKSRHLQKMSDPKSDLYKRAADKGVPEGFLLELRHDLHEFKQEWRAGGGLEALSRSSI